MRTSRPGCVQIPVPHAAGCSDRRQAGRRWDRHHRRPVYRFDAHKAGAATAGSLWAHIDQEIVGQAPWVPVYNPRSLVVLSRRVGNYQFDPYWSVLIDRLWVR
jgi:hypothetical protein